MSFPELDGFDVRKTTWRQFGCLAAKSGSKTSSKCDKKDTIKDCSKALISNIEGSSAPPAVSTPADRIG
jgi:hypothetical protein